MGPPPTMRAVSPSWIPRRPTARMMHARGSMKDATSKSIPSGSGRTPPPDTFHAGTRKNSANPPGSRWYFR